jgi:hypothetical protein
MNTTPSATEPTLGGRRRPRRGARLHRDAADDHRPARPVRAGKGRPAARELSIDRARREFDYEVGELAYWSPGNDIAIFYADDGQAIPQPGLVRLGTIDTGLDVIAAAGDDFEMTIEPLD